MWLMHMSPFAAKLSNRFAIGRPAQAFNSAHFQLTLLKWTPAIQASRFCSRSALPLYSKPEARSTMASSKERPEYYNDNFNKFVEDLMVDRKVLGASMAIIDGDDIKTKGYGLCEPDGLEVNEDTLFNCASMSKSFTSAAVALLVDDDKNYPDIKWYTPASHIIREDFVLTDAYLTEHVTLRDMLCHRTGMIDQDSIGRSLDSVQPDTPKSITRSLRHLPITKPFRTEFQYNNQMYTAASYLVETVMDKPFEDILRERFWSPLGMDKTYLDKERVSNNTRQDKGSNIAPGCYLDKEKQCFFKLANSNSPEGQGAGIIVSSAKDWARWVHAMIHQNPVLSKAAYTELHKPHIFMGEPGSPMQSPPFYCMGWWTKWYRGYQIISHSGGVPGFGCNMFFLPEKKWGFCMLGNTDEGGEVAGVVCLTLIDELLGVPEDERIDWTKADEAEGDPEAETEAASEEPKESVFPNRPDPPLPLQLPLEAYAGNYFHPSYHELIVSIRDGELVADMTDRTFGFQIIFKHVSGDYFVAVKEDVPNYTKNTQRMESMFEVGPSGKIDAVGIDFLEDETTDMIWFKRKDP